jgi:TonB family protein
MIGPMLLGLFLATAAVVAQATVQPVSTPVAPVSVQDPSEKPWLPEGVLKPGDGVTSPVVRVEFKPLYTPQAMRERISGVVEVAAIVEEDGTVGEVRVIRSLDKEFGLDAQAVNAVKRWEFRPGQKDGEPVRVMVKIELSFTLRDGR